HVVAIVALLEPANHAIATDLITDRGASVEEASQRELVVGLAGVTLGLEERDFVDAAFEDIEAGVVDLTGGHVDVARQCDAAIGRSMDAPDIDGESSVDEHPHVVVACEVEDLATPVLEVGTELGGEVVVVRAALI